MPPLPIAIIAKSLGVELADLSQVDDPRGRLDYLASKLFEGAAKTHLAPELQATYAAARPLIDGLLVKHLGAVRIAVPIEVQELVLRARGIVA